MSPEAPFVGRKAELERLKLLLKKRTASFVVIRGRRRIGKSRLIEEFGRSMNCHIFSGLPPSQMMSRQDQIDAFCKQMADEFDLPPFRVRDWHELFRELAKRCAKGKVLIALDEISWIGSKDRNFLGYLKIAWDLLFSKNPQLILIVCGSVSSWIEKNILSNTGFVGRISLNMRLEELPLHDASAFWDPRKHRISPFEILKVLSVTGGVPRYLEEILPELSAEENIRQLCFDSNGLLYLEFEQIFSDLFSTKAPHYIRVLESLEKGSHTLKEVQQIIKIARTATVSDYLQDLVQAGFVTEDPTWNLRTNKISFLKKYRLSDNYIRFYLKYILPNKERIAGGLFEAASLTSLPNWESIMGLQFENLVLKNAFTIFEAIGIKKSDVLFYGPYFQRPTARLKGCQIDLLIQARYRSVYLCEIKFRSGKVGLEVVRQLEAKRLALSLPRGWSSRLVLVHVNGVTQQVMEGDVDHIIDFTSLL